MDSRFRLIAVSGIAIDRNDIMSCRSMMTSSSGRSCHEGIASGRASFRSLRRERMAQQPERRVQPWPWLTPFGAAAWLITAPRAAGCDSIRSCPLSISMTAARGAPR